MRSIEIVSTASTMPLPLSAQVQARLLARLTSDLRVIELAAIRSYSLQAFTLLASMFEHAHVVSYIGTDDKRAALWLNHTEQRETYPKPLRVAVQATAELLGSTEASIKTEMGLYRLFCMVKHGNPMIQRGFGSSIAGDKLTVQLGPFVSSRTRRQAARAILYGCRYAAVAAYAYASPRIGEEQADFVEEFYSVVTNQIELLAKERPRRS